MKLPLSIAKNLLLLIDGEDVAGTLLKHVLVDKMVDDGVIRRQRIGKNRSIYKCQSAAQLADYLLNHLGIADLQQYIDGYANENLTRAAAVTIASNSKLKSIRTFKGFLVNTFEPIETILNGERLTINPAKGTFQFIHDFEYFLPVEDVVIVGIENAENFSNIHYQRHLFAGKKCLFISRYPQSQSGDVLRWLLSVSNQYLHFGDFDFEGINIYLREYKKHLGERAQFFIPREIESMLSTNGNRTLYDHQFHHQPDLATINESGIIKLLMLLHKYKKVLEQEALIGGQNYCG